MRGGDPGARLTLSPGGLQDATNGTVDGHIAAMYDRSAEADLGPRKSTLGRQRTFAASGSSRWPDLVAELLTRQRAPPPPNVKFRWHSRQPPEEQPNVKYRRPPTLTGQIRTAAESLKQPISLQTSARLRVPPSD